MVQVRFRGGPLAGQLHAMEQPPFVYRVPTYVPTRITEKDLALPVDCTYEIEEYRLNPSHDRGDCDYYYDWTNPSKELRQQLREQRETIQRYRDEAKELREALDGFREDARKWRELTNTVGKLLDEA